MEPEPPGRPTPEMNRHARKHAEAWLDALHPEARADLSKHDETALREAIAWALYRFVEAS